MSLPAGQFATRTPTNV